MTKMKNSSRGAGSMSNGYLPSQGGYKHINPPVFRSDSLRDAGTVEETCSHTSVSPDADEASVGVSIDAHRTEGKYVMQDFDAATEDVESTDGNSKSEDFGGEQGEDGWEGAMFPFAEDC
eukprot:c22885_g1_i3 orf=473-832(+)